MGGALFMVCRGGIRPDVAAFSADELLSFDAEISEGRVAFGATVNDAHRFSSFGLGSE